MPLAPLPPSEDPRAAAWRVQGMPDADNAAGPAALSNEQRRLLDFGRASGDWMWELDEHLVYRWVTGAVESVTGIAADALIGQPINGDFPLLDALGMPEPHGRRLGELLQQREPISRALTEKRTPRGVLYISRSAVPVFDASGRFAGFRGTARDMTAHIETARRSHAQDMLLRQLSSQLPGVIFQLQMDADGVLRYPYASEGVRELFGIAPPQGADGDRAAPLRVLHPDDRSAYLDSIQASAHLLRPWQHEYRIVRGDGSVRWLETRATPQRLPDGSTLWHGFAADVSERKEIEIALRRSEERWEMAAAAAGIGIIELDLEGDAARLDRRACTHHGVAYPLTGFTLADWMLSILSPDRDGVRAALQDALETQGVLETRYRVPQPDGHVPTLEVVARGHFDAQGRPLGLVGTCRDVTSQIVGERLQRDKEAAERANRAKSEFLSRVSHELRTPLNGILGFAQLMSIDRVHPLVPEQRRRIDSVLRASRHLLGLINDVLDVTRIESEDFSLKPATFDAWSAISDCLSLIQPLADRTDVKLPAPGLHDPHWVHAAPRAFEQVLMNLLSNAIKYNRPGGSVELSVVTDATRVHIAVRDNGLGMSPEQQAALFQPFNRLGAEQSRTEGSGLGLVISRQLVEAMDGVLRVHSQPGAGSTFTVELPRGESGVPAPVQATFELTAPTGLPAAPREVLYIEDEPVNAILMEEVFRTRPHWTLQVAENGTRGALIAREAQPDLVLIDMNLPDMHGLTLIHRLRDDPATRHLRCIALSADAMSEQIGAALAAGFDDYWTKPIDVTRVLSDLTRLLAEPTDTQR